MVNIKNRSTHPDFKINFTSDSSAGPPRKKRVWLTFAQQHKLQEKVKALEYDIILKDEENLRLLGIIKKYEDQESN